MSTQANGTPANRRWPRRRPRSRGERTAIKKFTATIGKLKIARWWRRRWSFEPRFEAEVEAREKAKADAQVEVDRAKAEASDRKTLSGPKAKAPLTAPHPLRCVRLAR